jgi:DnaK suppressor protein
MNGTTGKKTGAATRHKQETRSSQRGLDLGEIERRLLHERGLLLSELSSEAFTQSDIGQWQERDSPSEDEIREVMYTRRETQRRRIKQLDEALERLKAGSFAKCINCGDEIAARRLESDPAVSLCIECAKQFDEPAQGYCF